MPRETLRQQMIALLSEGARSARELSQILRIPEKDVYSHLPHIARSVSARKKRLTVLPCCCLECGYVFGDRKRFARPSRCPRCRAERIQEPRFQVE